MERTIQLCQRVESQLNKVVWPNNSYRRIGMGKSDEVSQVRVEMDMFSGRRVKWNVCEKNELGQWKIVATFKSHFQAKKYCKEEGLEIIK